MPQGTGLSVIVANWAIILMSGPMHSLNVPYMATYVA